VASYLSKTPSERRRRDRRRPKRKTFSLKQFLRDYPIVAVILLSLVVGLFGGYFFGYGKAAGKSALESKILKKMEMTATAVSAPSVSVTPPKRAPKKVVPEKKPIIETTLIEHEKKPKIAFVIDDIGYNKRYAELLFSIKQPLTLAILPRLAFSKYYADEAGKRNLPVLLHLPLEPDGPYDDPGPGAIMSQMSVTDIKEVLEENLASVPTAVGVNNHMGSNATRDRSVMYSILKEIKSRKLFFLDSMTHPDSVGYQVGFGLGMPVLKRDVFLDNIDDFDYVTEQIRKTAEVAMFTGSAVAIGHPRDHTLEALKEMIPKLEAQGFEIVPVTEFLETKEN
jgi:polysaccharide deacetylase 2 family uncharacterized protein YibQ